MLELVVADPVLVAPSGCSELEVDEAIGAALLPGTPADVEPVV